MSIKDQQAAIAALPESIRRMMAASAAKADSDPETAALEAEVDELLEENQALQKDLAELNARLVKYDDLVMLWERAGLDGIEANYRQQIKALEQRVEEATADRWKAIRQRDYWKKRAIALGYVPPYATEGRQA